MIGRDKERALLMLLEIHMLAVRFGETSKIPRQSHVCSCYHMGRTENSTLSNDSAANQGIFCDESAFKSKSPNFLPFIENVLMPGTLLAENNPWE